MNEQNTGPKCSADRDPRVVVRESLAIARPCEIVLAFVAAVGVDLKVVEDAAESRLREVGYEVIHIRVTDDVLPLLDPNACESFGNMYFHRISTMMDVGNEARKKYGCDVVACGIAAAIRRKRADVKSGMSGVAYFVHSLKHPDEVRRLRECYPRGFYLIGVHAPPDTRRRYLIYERNVNSAQAKLLMDRDKQEPQSYGQNLVDTFHLADYFSGWRDGKDAKECERYRQFVKNNVSRFVDIIFAHPNKTPTFGEYAMYLAFAASLRSADLSRQVGAVITREREIIGTGANDCPKANGGLYWPMLNPDSLQFEDSELGRDWTRGVDSNKEQLVKLKSDLLDDARATFATTIRHEIERGSLGRDIAKRLENLAARVFSRALEKSQIGDLTEFGRVVHAEMEALLSCARNGISTVGSTLFSTTFPCHNCAKHIVAAGVDRVVFIEPYLKSKALTLHDDSIELAYPNPLRKRTKKRPRKVQFEPFVGVGPRRFFELFSMNTGIGMPLKRKEATGRARKWNACDAKVRVEIISESYLERESLAADGFFRRVSTADGLRSIP